MKVQCPYCSQVVVVPSGVGEGQVVGCGCCGQTFTLPSVAHAPAPPVQSNPVDGPLAWLGGISRELIVAGVILLAGVTGVSLILMRDAMKTPEQRVAERDARMDMEEKLLDKQRADEEKRERVRKDRELEELRREREIELALRPKTVTMGNYQRVLVGMKEDDVFAILGVLGEERSSSRIGGITTKMYEWKEGRGVIHVIVQNGTVTSKSQYGLQ